MSAPVEDTPEAPAPSQAEQDVAQDEKIIRQVTLIAYAGGGFRIMGPEGFNPMNDLGGLLGDLEYAKKWVLEQWELGFMGARVETAARLQSEIRRNTPTLVPGTAAPAFLRGPRGRAQ